MQAGTEGKNLKETDLHLGESPYAAITIKETNTPLGLVTTFLSLNRPVDVKALEQKKNGVLLLSRLHSGTVGLHGHKSMFDQRYPQVVQLSCINSDKNTTRHLNWFPDSCEGSV